MRTIYKICITIINHDKLKIMYPYNNIRTPQRTA